MGHQNPRLIPQEALNAVGEELLSDIGVDSTERIIQQVNMCVAVAGSGERESCLLAA